MQPSRAAHFVQTTEGELLMSATAPTPGTDLDLVHEDGIEKVRGSLAEIQSASAAFDVAKRADAAATYYGRAKETRSLADTAVEIRAWAERRAGELLAAEGIDYAFVADRARELEAGSQTLRRWLRFAKAKESHFTQVITEIKGGDGEMTVTAIDRRLQMKGIRRVERGIYLNYLGAYVLRWRSQGVTRQATIGSGDIRDARHQLNVRKGLVPAGPTTTTHAALNHVYSSIRMQLDRLEQLRGEATGPLHELMGEAQDGLYRAEDAVSQALRLAR